MIQTNKKKKIKNYNNNYRNKKQKIMKTIQKY